MLLRIRVVSDVILYLWFSVLLFFPDIVSRWSVVTTVVKASGYVMCRNAIMFERRNSFYSRSRLYRLVLSKPSLYRIPFRIKTKTSSNFTETSPNCEVRSYAVSQEIVSIYGTGKFFTFLRKSSLWCMS